MAVEWKLLRSKSKPGSLVQRFGDWKKGEPQVLLENHQWTIYGKPDIMSVIVGPKADCNCKCHNGIGAPPCGHCYKED